MFCLDFNYDHLGAVLSDALFSDSVDNVDTVPFFLKTAHLARVRFQSVPNIAFGSSSEGGGVVATRKENPLLISRLLTCSRVEP